MVRALAVSAALLFVALPTEARQSPDNPVVRVVSPRLAETLRLATPKSATLRALLATLAESDVIVHIAALSERDRHRGLAGTMKFVTARGGKRFLRIAVDENLPLTQRAVTLAHELQHAVEVAEAPQIVDEASFGAFYSAVGHKGLEPPNFRETRAALDLSARVMAELVGRPLPAGVPTLEADTVR